MGRPERGPGPLRVVLAGAVREGRWALPGPAAHYVGRVHRARRGDKLVLVDPVARTQAYALVPFKGDAPGVSVGNLTTAAPSSSSTARRCAR